MAKKGHKMKHGKMPRHRASFPHLHRPKMSVIGKSAFAGNPPGPAMAFPAAGDGGGGPAFGAPDLSGGGGAAPPMLGPGGGPPEQ